MQSSAWSGDPTPFWSNACPISSVILPEKNQNPVGGYQVSGFGERRRRRKKPFSTSGIDCSFCVIYYRSIKKVSEGQFVQWLKTLARNQETDLLRHEVSWLTLDQPLPLSPKKNAMTSEKCCQENLSRQSLRIKTNSKASPKIGKRNKSAEVIKPT